MYHVFTVNLFAYMINLNCKSWNITFLYTEVFLYEIVPYFWIFILQAFLVSNIKKPGFSVRNLIDDYEAVCKILS